MENAIFKYNGGLGALLCSNCSVIIKFGSSFNDEDLKAIRGEVDMPPQYCKQCKSNSMEPKAKAAYLVVKYMSKVVSKRVAIECALVAVDELLNEYNGMCPEGSYEMERYLYFTQVKQEIEKL